MEPELRPGERLLWSGRPQGGIRFSRSDLLATLLMIPWTLFAVFFTMAALRPRLWCFGALVGLIFVVVGLYALVGRFFLDSWKRARRFYGITNDRLVVATEFLSRRSQSQQLATLNNLALDRRSDGSGMISVGPWAWLSQLGYQRPEPDITFEQLTDCASVFSRIVEARETANGVKLEVIGFAASGEYDDVRRVLEQELLPGEDLLWSGRPGHRLQLVLTDLWTVPFGLVVFLVGLAFALAPDDADPDRAARVFGMVAAPVGLYIAFGDWIATAWRRRKTCYGVTTRRVIVVRYFPTFRAKSQYLGTLSNLGMKTRKDGSGTITFGPWGLDEAARFFYAGHYGPPPRLSFSDVAACAEAYDVIVRAQAALRGRAG